MRTPARPPRLNLTCRARNDTVFRVEHDDDNAILAAEETGHVLDRRKARSSY